MMSFKNELNGPKRKRLLLCLSGLALLGVCALLGFRGYMNYQGYCWEDGVYLADYEKIRRVVQDVLRDYPPAIVPLELCVEGCEGSPVRVIPLDELPKKAPWQQSAPDHPIPYKGLDEFFSENPGCCELRQDQQWDPRSAEFGVPSFFERITGKEVGYVRIRYWVKYLKDGNEHRLRASYYAGLSTCAKPSWKNVIPHYLEELREKAGQSPSSRAINF